MAAALLVPASVAAAPKPAVAESAPAAPTGELFAAVRAPDADDLPLRVPTTRERFVVPDVGALRQAVEAAAAGGRLRLTLFDDVVIDLPTSQYLPRPDGFSWNGYGVGPDGNSQVANITYQLPTPEQAAAGKEPVVIADFWAGHPVRQYKLERATGAVYAIGEVDQSRLADDHGDYVEHNHADDAEAAAPHGHEADTEAEASAEAELPQPTVPMPASTMNHNGLHVVDVMVVYTQMAQVTRPDLLGSVNQWLNTLNGANNAVGAPVHFRLVHFAQVNYAESGSIQQDYQNLAGGGVNGADTMRQQSYADIVSMAVSYTNINTCGVGTINGPFSVVSVAPNCEGMTLAHEVGHNMGFRHDWTDDPTPGNPYYAKGFVSPPGSFRTLLGVRTDLCRDCGRIPYWSNPGQTYNGVPTGVPRDQPNPADNAGALLEGAYINLENLMTPPQLPIGNYDTIQQTPAGTNITGWAIDFDTPTAPVTIHVYDNNRLYGGFAANKPRPDLPSYYPNAGSHHGFDEFLVLDEGTHNVCVYALDTTNPVSMNTFLGCKSFYVKINPFGSFDGVRRVPGGAEVYGWAIDPDAGQAPTTATAWVTGDPEPTTGPAANHRPDLNQFGYGPNHGFDFKVETSSGNKEFCLTADNVGHGVTQSIGCASFFLAADPFGDITAIRRTPTGVKVEGWAIDPDVAEPIAVRFTVDGVAAAADVAAVERSDVGGAYPAYGPRHGFSTTVPAVSGATREVCAVGTNVQSGADAVLDCASIHVNADPFGFVDSIWRDATPDMVTVAGWAIEPDTTNPAVVRVTVDGVVAHVESTPEERPDVAAAHPEYGPLRGYRMRVPLTAGPHRVCVTFVNAGPGADQDKGCWDFGDPSSPYGNIDWIGRSDPGVVEVGGWAIDWETAQPIPVRATVDGNPVMVTVANEHRSDVGAAYPWHGPNHGYTMRIPVAPGAHTVCITAVNTGPGTDTTLGCPTV